MRRACSFALTALLLVLARGSASAEGLQGAKAALNRLARRTASDAGLDAGAALRRDLEEYLKKAPGMPPPEAAQGWLALADRYMGLTSQQLAMQETGEPLGFADVLTALPPPAAWDALAAAISARMPAAGPQKLTDRTWLLLAHLLKGDQAAQRQDLEGLVTAGAKANPKEKQAVGGVVVVVMDLLSEQDPTPERVLQALNLRIALLGAGQTSSLSVPDLVTRVGARRAEAVLRKLLVTYSVQIQVVGEPTLKLAQRLALELAPKLKVPQWGLVQSIDAVPLFEALQKQFPAPKRPAPPKGAPMGFEMEGVDYNREAARCYYMAGLIGQRRVKEAVALAPGLRGPAGAYGLSSFSGAIDALVRAGHAKELNEFFVQTLSRSPDLDLWDPYFSFAFEQRKVEAAIPLMRSLLARKGLTLRTQRVIREHLVQALLAQDKPEAAVVVIRQLVHSPGSDEENDGVASGVTWAVKLARLGLVLEKKEWVAEGVASARAATVSEQYTNTGREVFRLLEDVGRTVNAEELVFNALEPSQREEFTDPGSTPEALVDLVGLYHRAGRHADVLLLLDGAPTWGVRDLSELLVQTDVRDTPLGYMAAAALAGTGKKQEAANTVRALLRQRGDFDGAYELLVELQGEKAIPFLEAQAARDPYQERPLIWKAEALRRAGRLEEAEQAVKAAIAIDPSDGEQQYGRRMRGYTVLADILEGRGDRKQAEFFREVVRSIRMSERADTLHEVGLLGRAIKLYQEALTHFADAYCIQSRLAIQLAAQGRFQEAEEHYRRAYELMPDSFGRVETHCFGCEGIFEGKQAQFLAEKVFLQLAAKTPDKPQVHYLLGYLRVSQGRYTEALEHFRNAVRRDPAYLNAWKEIYGLGSYIHLSDEDREAAAAAILRLDPLQEHNENQTELPDVRDLRVLWEIGERAAKLRADEKLGPLYPLAASVKLLERQAEQNPAIRAMMRRGLGRWRADWEVSNERPITSPGDAVAQQKLVGFAAQLFDAERQLNDGEN